MTHIRTNNVPRNFVYYWELSDKEKAEHPYLREESVFFRYKGGVYALENYLRISHPDMKGWDGCEFFTMSSGLCIKLVENDRVVVGTFWS